MPIPLLAIAGASLAAKEGFSLLNNSIANNNARQMAAYNDQLQRKLMVDSPSLNAEGLRRAGFSVASLNGNFSSTPSTGNASSPAAPESPDPTAAMSAALSMQTQEKQNELLDTQIDRQKLENDEIRDRQNAFRQSMANAYWLDDDGHKVYYTDADHQSRVDAYSKRHNGQAPELIVPVGHLSSQAYNADSDVAMSRNNFYGNLLSAEVSRLKLKDPSVIHALTHMEKQTYDNLQQTGRNLLKDWHIKDNQIKIGNIDIDIRKIDKDVREQQKLEEVINYKLLKLRYESERDTNIRPLVTQLLNNGLDMSTIGKLLVAVLLKQFNM